MATKPVFWGVDDLGLGESAPLSIPIKSLVLGQKSSWRKSGGIPSGFVNISSIQLRYRRTGTGNLYLKFASAHTSQTTGSTPTEDVDTYTTYTVASADNAIANITVPASAYNGLSGMVAGDTLTLGVYRDDSVATDTYTTDFDVLGFLIVFTTGASVSASTGDRSKKILGKVLLALTGSTQLTAKAITAVPEAVFYSKMGEVQTELCQELLCLEKSASLVVSSSSVAEPDGFFRLKLMELSDNLLYQPREIDIEDYDMLSRMTFSGLPQTPSYYKRWGGTIKFYPSVSSDTYTVYYWAIPTTTPSSTVDPETPERFDRSIEYGVIADLAPAFNKPDLVGLYQAKYGQEKQKYTNFMATGQSRTYEIASHE